MRGALGALGALRQHPEPSRAISLASELISEGRPSQIELPGFDPEDYPIDHEIKDIDLGKDEKGHSWDGDVAVKLNPVRINRFYPIRTYLKA